MHLPDIELVAAKVHESWIEGKIAKGIKSRKAEDGEELMVPYERLSEPQKDQDRNTVKAVYAAIIETECHIRRSAKLRKISLKESKLMKSKGDKTE